MNRVGGKLNWNKIGGGGCMLNFYAIHKGGGMERVVALEVE